MFGDQQQNSGTNDMSTMALPPQPTTDAPQTDPVVDTTPQISPAPAEELGAFLDDDTPASDAASAPQTAPEPTTTTTVASPHDDDKNGLLDIKKEALGQLSPLVGHLEQSPEEKFRTTMMMIQATDDHSLVKAAYDAAQSITDDKARAQALLDVINEINYFTQKND